MSERVSERASRLVEVWGVLPVLLGGGPGEGSQWIYHWKQQPCSSTQMGRC